MKKARTRYTRLMSILLCAVLFMTAVCGTTGCAPSESASASQNESPSAADGESAGENGEETIRLAEAEAVEYAADGAYTTTLTLEDGTFADVTAADIEIFYTLSSADGETDEAETKDAEVLSASVNGDGSLALEFKDPDAAANKTEGYGVLIEKLGVGADIDVFSNEYTATCDREYVLSTDDAVKLTFTLSGGSFAEPVTADEIALSGSFENMTVESLSAAGKNLTVQLAGEIAFHESSNAYLDGTVTVSADAVQNTLYPLEVRIPVKMQSAYLDEENLQAENDEITVPLVLQGAADAEALTPEDVALDADGVTVESVAASGGDEALLVLHADGATDKNAAAALLENATVQVGDTEFTAGFTPASFYPVFDYIEDKDGALEITAELYAINGTFAETLDPAGIAFGGDFADAAVTRFTRTGDTTAELVFTTAANGQTAETVDQDGEITLPGGTLRNRWGDAKPDETAYLRNYSAENLGRAAENTDASTLFQMASEVGKQVSSVVGGALSTYNAISTFLDVIGVVPSEQTQLLQTVQEIKKHLVYIEEALGEQTKLLKGLAKNDMFQQLNTFEGHLNQMTNACNALDRYLADAGKHVEQPTDKSDESQQQYAIALMNYCKENASSYFTKTVDELYNHFTAAMEMLRSTNLNPVSVYDALCAEEYNFDTQSVSCRQDFRTLLLSTSQRSLSYLVLYYCFCDNDENAGISLAEDHYATAMKQFDKYKTVTDTRPDNYAYCYVLGENVCLNQAFAIEMPSEKKWGVELRAIKGKTENDDFTKAEREEFVKRMHGRTLREEMNASGFSNFGKNNSPGVAFWVERKKQSIKWYTWADSKRHPDDYKDYYAYVINWDSTKMDYVQIGRGLIGSDGNSYGKGYKQMLEGRNYEGFVKY